MNRQSSLALVCGISFLLILLTPRFLVRGVSGAEGIKRQEDAADEMTFYVGGWINAGHGCDVQSAESRAVGIAWVSEHDLIADRSQSFWMSAQAIGGSGGAAQSDNGARMLESGKPIERDLAGGEAHHYTITLTSGHFLHVIAEQRGIDIIVELSAPDGKKLSEVNSSNGPQGSESALVIAEASGDYRVEIRSADKTAVRGRYEVKIQELRMATALDRSRGAAERVFQEGEQLRKQGTAESRRSALERYETVLPLWRAAGERLREVQTLNVIGQVYSALGEKQKSLDRFLQALHLSQDAGDRQWEATTLRSIGLTYSLSGENQKALDYYTRALPLLRAVGDRFGESLTLNNIGTVYWSLGENQKALNYYKQALPLRQALGDRRGEAYTLHGIGLVYFSLGENQKALDYYSQTLQLWQALGDRSGEGNILNTIGLTYSSLGENQKALDYYAKALQLRRIVGDRREEAYTLNNIGLVYFSLGEPQKALDYYSQALPLLRAVGDRRGEAYTLHNIGNVYGDLSENQKALDYYSQSLLLKRAIGDRSGEALTLNNIGLIYAALGNPQKALDYYSQTLQLQLVVGDRRGQASTLNNIGKVYLTLGQEQKALDYFNQALPLRRAVEDRNGEAITLASIARVHRDRGDLVEAREQIESALNIVESLRAKVVSQELRASYFASKRDYYEFYIDLLMRLHRRHSAEGYDVAALQASERARARSLLEILTEARADIRQGVDPALIERERSLQQQLSAKADRLTRLLSGSHTKEQAEAARKELEGNLAQYQEVQSQIRASSPRYAALTQPVPLSLKEIQQQVLDDGTILLEYSLGEERSFLWAVTPTSMTSFELPGRSEIEKQARRLYELLTARNRHVPNESPERERARLDKADTEYLQAAAITSQMLLGPVATQLGTKRLLIVSEGALQYVPFGALPVPIAEDRDQGIRVRDNANQALKPQPLIVEHEIVTLPSASVLALLRHELAGRKVSDKVLAVLADPVFESDDPRVRPKGRPQLAVNDSSFQHTDIRRSAGELGLMSFKRLRFSRREAEQITALVLEGKSLKALDFMASRTTAKADELGQYRFLHFATHALLNSSHPELSGVVLSLVNEQGQPQDGFLRLYEIYNLKLRADLVVLSACQTALGKDVKGEGLVGMTRGFMYAGAARVVASLWSVEDVVTAELMKRFYQGMMKEGLRPVAALRAAQVSMWREKRWEAPYYWAAFILQGEWK